MLSLETSDLPVIFRQLCKTFSEKYNVSSVVNTFCLKEFFILLILGPTYGSQNHNLFNAVGSKN